MFTKVLIANRGEIACRMIRTLDGWASRSVAVYSDADAHSLHVARPTKPSTSGRPRRAKLSDAERILDARKATGAQAIHPGYGFLSENPDFADACADAGIVFIGPTPDQMRAFGLKHTARELAAAARRAVVSRHGCSPMPTKRARGRGAHRLSGDAQEHRRRRRHRHALCRDPTRTAPTHSTPSNASARHNFKDAGIFLEKFVEHAPPHRSADLRRRQGQRRRTRRARLLRRSGATRKSSRKRPPRHSADASAPSSSSTRPRTLGQAVELPVAPAPSNSSTIPPTGEFYFLEVNTRLQVEHGVTEEVTGVDLVEWMVRAAAGESHRCDIAPAPQRRLDPGPRLRRRPRQEFPAVPRAR